MRGSTTLHCTYTEKQETDPGDSCFRAPYPNSRMFLDWLIRPDSRQSGAQLEGFANASKTVDASNRTAYHSNPRNGGALTWSASNKVEMRNEDETEKRLDKSIWIPYHNNPRNGKRPSQRSALDHGSQYKAQFFDEIRSIASPSQFRLRYEFARTDWVESKQNNRYQISTMESLILAQDERWRRA